MLLFLALQAARISRGRQGRSFVIAASAVCHPHYGIFDGVILYEVLRVHLNGTCTSGDQDPSTDASGPVSSFVPWPWVQGGLRMPATCETGDPPHIRPRHWGNPHQRSPKNR